MRTTIADLIQLEENRVRERAEAERRNLDDAVRARLAAEENARERERKRDEAEARLRDQRERDAREEGARLQATHHASVVAVREKLERDLRELDAIKASMHSREATWRARARAAWMLAVVSTSAVVGLVAFAFIARDPVGSVAKARQLDGVALELRNELGIERDHVAREKRRVATLEQHVAELESRPPTVAPHSAVGLAPSVPQKHGGTPVRSEAVKQPGRTCAQGDPLCTTIP